MSNIKRVLAALGVGLTLAIGGAAVAMQPASADEWDTDVPCTIDNFSPRSVTVGLSPVVRTFGVSTSDCSEQSYWRVQTSDTLVYTFPSGSQETFNPHYLSNSDAGGHDVIVDADNGDWNETTRVFSNGFRLKRNTLWQSNSFNASPEPVTRGKAITVKGRLKIANWNTMSYTGFGNRDVKIQFKTSTGSWTTIKTVKTRSDGWFSTTTTAKRSGSWRAVYAGNSSSGSRTSAGDYVQVK